MKRKGLSSQKAPNFVAVQKEKNIVVDQHQPVLLSEAIEGLVIKPNGIYVDGTFGRGGHAQVILEHLSSCGRLFAIDKDPEAIKIAKQRFSKDQRFHIWHGSFTELPAFLETFDIQGGVDGIFLDLGVSSPQLNDASRGFSFQKDGPLDMRMNPQSGMDAATWLAQVSERELVEVLKVYGEERYARKIAKAIVDARKKNEITRTKQLADIIALAIPTREKHKHPATRSFQAIRIFINHELDELQKGLEQSLEYLAVGGRLVVISFHSLEDRIVKRFIQKNEKGEELPKGLPIKQKDFKQRLKRIGKAIKPSEQEIAFNPRSRSAMLRITEKLR